MLVYKKDILYRLSNSTEESSFRRLVSAVGTAEDVNETFVYERKRNSCTISLFIGDTIDCKSNELL